MQGARVDGGAAGIGVGARQNGGAAAHLLQRARAADHPIHGQRITTVDRERAVVEDVADQTSCRAAGADLQRARADRRAAGIGVHGGQGGRTVARLHECAAAADHAGQRHRIAPVDRERGVVHDIPADAARRAAGADLQRAGIDRRAPGVRVRCVEDHRTGTFLPERTRAADHTGERRVARAGINEIAATGDATAHGHRIAAVDRQGRVVHHIAGDAARRAARADLQRAGVDRRAAGVGIGAGQDRRAAALLDNVTRSTDHPGHRDGVAAVERHRGVVDDITCNASGSSARTQLKHAGVDGCAAGVGVGASQRRRALADVCYRAAAADHPRERRGVAAVETDGARIGDIARQAAGGAAGADLERPGGHLGAAHVGVVAGQRRRAGAGLHQHTRTADDPGEGGGVGTVELQRGVVRDIAGDTSRRTTGADLQRASGHRGATGVGVVARQYECAEVGFFNSTGSDDRRADGAGHKFSRKRAVARPQHRGGGVRRQRTTGHGVAVDCKLQAGDDHGTARDVDCNRARGALKNRHTRLPPALIGALRRTPVGRGRRS